jgi:hypothetical protein
MMWRRDQGGATPFSIPPTIFSNMLRFAAVDCGRGERNTRQKLSESTLNWAAMLTHRADRHLPWLD